MRTLRLRGRGLGLAVAWLASSSAAGAADVRGAELVVQRQSGTEDCPDEKVLASELSGRIGLDVPGASSDESRARNDTRLTVTLAREGDGYVATIRAEGANPGVRTLRAVGPTCGALHDALGIALLVLLDPRPMPEPAQAPKPPVAPVPVAPAAEAPPAAEPAAKADTAPMAQTGNGLVAVPAVWASAGVALTHGLPVSWSGAAFGDLLLDGPAGWGVAVGGFVTLESNVDAPPGRILIHAYGARLRGCHAVLSASAAPVRLSACAAGNLALLQGEARDFSSNDSRLRPWLSAGPLADFEFRWSSRWSIGIEAAALFAPHQERFAIEGIRGIPFRTDPVVGWLGTDLRFRLW